MPLAYLIALFIGLPIVELALLFELHGVVGFFPTVLIVFVTGAAGAALVRRQGIAILLQIQREMSVGNIPAPQMIDGVMILLAGALLYFPGVGLYLWGYTSLGRLFAPSSSRGAELYSDHQLITTGPHRIVRHPMYLGVLLAAFGALLIFRTWAMIPYALSSLAVIARAKREEQLLAEDRVKVALIR